MERIACDVVVVGGGSGGCVVAGRLAGESDARVVVVEAGPDYGLRESGRWPDDLLDGGALVTSHDWGYASAEIPGREPIAFPRARVMGGCSSHNGCVVAVGCPDDYDRWAAATGDTRWSAAAVRPAFARALERMGVRTYRDDEVGPFHRACLDAAAALGLPRADDLDDLDGGVGFGIEPVNVEDGVRVNAAFAYVDPVRSRPNLEILDRALCDRIVPGGSGNELVVWRDGVELRVEARVVVLAAGAYGSPAILQRSGVGDPTLLHAAGITPLLELPGVGRNLPRPPARRARVARLRRDLDREALKQPLHHSPKSREQTSQEAALGPRQQAVRRSPSLPRRRQRAPASSRATVILVVAAVDQLFARQAARLRRRGPNTAPTLVHVYLLGRRRRLSAPVLHRASRARPRLAAEQDHCGR